jgi:hypothetical protein
LSPHFVRKSLCRNNLCFRAALHVEVLVSRPIGAVVPGESAAHLPYPRTGPFPAGAVGKARIERREAGSPTVAATFYGEREGRVVQVATRRGRPPADVRPVPRWRGPQPAARMGGEPLSLSATPGSTPSRSRAWSSRPSPSWRSARRAPDRSVAPPRALRRRRPHARPRQTAGPGVAAHSPPQVGPRDRVRHSSEAVAPGACRESHRLGGPHRMPRRARNHWARAPVHRGHRSPTPARDGRRHRSTRSWTPTRSPRARAPAPRSPESPPRYRTRRLERASSEQLLWWCPSATSAVRCSGARCDAYLPTRLGELFLGRVSLARGQARTSRARPPG